MLTNIRSNLSALAALALGIVLAACSSESSIENVELVGTGPIDPVAPEVEVLAFTTGDEGEELFFTALLNNEDEAGDVTYEWAQIAGPTVFLEDDDEEISSATMPLVAADTELTFELTATGPTDLKSTATHTVLVSPAPLGTLVEIQTEVDNERRIYTVYTPESVTAPAPMVYALHGASGNMRDFIAEGETPRRWLDLADANGFIVVVPNGFSIVGNNGLGNNQGWNSTTPFTDADDVEFLLTTIEEIAAARTVDTDQVFFTGASNGGDMAMRMAIERPNDVKAIASYVSNLSNDPVPVPRGMPLPPTFLFMGTEDPISNFDGTGFTFSARETVDYFAEFTMSVLTPEPPFSALPDFDPNDGCQIFGQAYENAAGDPTVFYYEGVGSGHNIPDSDPNVNEPSSLSGTLCRDANGIDLAWDFFQSVD